MNPIFLQGGTVSNNLETSAGEAFIFFNGDYSGNCAIRFVRRTPRHDHSKEIPEGEQVIVLPFEVLERFVAEKVRSERIAKLKSADYETILGLKGENP